MTLDTIETEILFYISLKNPTRVDSSSSMIEYVFNGNEIKKSQKRLQIFKKLNNYSILLDTEYKNKTIVSSVSNLDLSMNSSDLNDVLLKLFLSHEAKEDVFKKNNPTGLFQRLQNILNLIF